MTNQHDTPQPEEPTPPGGNAPISGQPWSTPSGDTLSPEPYQRPRPTYTPGSAPIPEPDYPPTSQFPPVNYAPPGYAPDYGGGYAPQPGGYAPPPAYAPQPPGYGPPPGYPPRKSNAPLVAVILAVALLLCGGVVTAGVLVARGVANKAKEVAAPFDVPTEAPTFPGLPTELPTDAAGSGRKISVTYEVTGDGPVSIVYLEKVGDTPVRLSDVKLPWKFTTQMETPALLSVVVLRVGASTGTVSCKASVDGDEVKSNTSDDANFATVTCTHLALD
ncbi:MmpS family transport accessory protein [Actinoplanes sp. CA-142083]|uniref:MmpS family transport accessory protein n=1 Tax=Actinoplanes sp. CA-142083 TaxID=3239903 RepID=UPI003D8CB80E